MNEISLSDLSKNSSQNINNSNSFDLPEILPKERSPKPLPKRSFLQNRKILIGIICLLVLSVAAVSVFAFSLFSKKTDSKSDSKTTVADNVRTATSSTPTPTPKPPVYLASPINGIPIEESVFNSLSSKPALAVIIQNNTPSRPQHGINEADIMYETLAEGGITRFMGVFWSRDSLDRVMSVRSARKVFVDLLGDYNNPVFMHIGYSDGDPSISAIKAIRANGIRDLADTRDTQTNELSFSRDKACERIKATEHCAYSTTKRLWQIASEKNWTSNINSLTPWLFKEKGTQSTNSPGAALTDFSFTFSALSANLFGVEWKYDSVQNNYKRFNLNKTPFVDNTGKQVSSDVVIFQNISSVLSPIDHKHLVQDVIGSGTGYVMQDGKVYPVTWKKPNFKTRTKYYDATTGREFIFNKGRFWITLPPKNVKFKDLTPATPSPLPTATTAQ